VADRIISQGDKAAGEDKRVLGQFKGCGDDTSMDSVNSILVVLSYKNEGKE
jgi:hypothetical protein